MIRKFKRRLKIKKANNNNYVNSYYLFKKIKRTGLFCKVCVKFYLIRRALSDNEPSSGNYR